MTPQTAVMMAHYNRWMNQRMYEAAATLPPAEVSRDRGAFFGSLLHTLNHIAVADTIWLQRFVQHPAAAAMAAQLAALPRPTSLRQPLADSLEGLWQYRAALDGHIDGWAGSLTAAQLASPLHYRNLAGRPAARNLGLLVLHFFNHQTHHRGQASTLLFQAGVDVGVTDLFALIPEEPATAVQGG